MVVLLNFSAEFFPAEIFSTEKFSAENFSAEKCSAEKISAEKNFARSRIGEAAFRGGREPPPGPSIRPFFHINHCDLRLVLVDHFGEADLCI